MKHLVCVAVAILTSPLALTNVARADGQALDLPTESERGHTAARAAETGAFLPTTLSPRVGDQSAWAIGLAGYDSGLATSLFTAATEVTVTDRLALRAGATLDTGSVGKRLQPNVGLRLQILSQSQGHLVDGAVALFYRRERYSYDEGLIQGAVSFGHTFGRLAGFVNLAYGQDPEGDDRDGELRLALLYRAGEHFCLGVDSRLRVDLWSSDARRIARNESSRDLVAGPVVVVTVGSWALLAQTGVSQTRTAETHTGFLAMGGAATVF